VVIAIALACSPQLVLADEPTTGLDGTVQAEILELLASLQRERNMAVILITHDLGVAASRADDIVVMYAGRVVEQAPARTLFTDTWMPYTRALVDSTPRLSDPSGTRLRTIAGNPPDPIHKPDGCRFSPRCPFVQDRCRHSEPPLRTAGTPDHLFACWFPLINGTSTAPTAPNGGGDLVTVRTDPPSSDLRSGDAHDPTSGHSGGVGRLEPDRLAQDITPDFSSLPGVAPVDETDPEPGHDPGADLL
jgi:oligopeptide/dipeptide ABC transporter ATP-binding protein